MSIKSVFEYKEGFGERACCHVEADGTAVCQVGNDCFTLRSVAEWDHFVKIVAGDLPVPKRKLPAIDAGVGLYDYLNYGPNGNYLSDAEVDCLLKGVTGEIYDDTWAALMAGVSK